MTKRVFSVEFKKLFFRKALLISTAIFILVALCVVIFSVFADNNFTVGKPYEVIVNTEFLQTELSDIENELNNTDISKIERDNLRISLVSVNFFLKTNTVRESYYADNFNTRDSGALLMKRFCLYGTIITALFAVISALAVFGGEYKGHFRMSIMQGAPKKALFIGKTLSGITVLGAVFVVFALASFICALFSPKTYMLSIDYFRFTVKSTPIMLQYLAEITSMLLCSIFIYSLTLFLCAFFKKNGIVLGCLAAFFTICLILVYGVNSVGYRQSAFFPLLSLLQLSQNGFTLAYALALSVHAVISALLYLATYYLFRRQSF